MKAKINATMYNANNSDKPLIGTYSAVGIIDGELKELVTVRIHMSARRDATVVYANIWVRGKMCTSGTGKAGGLGYHKPSAALDEAIRSAGIELDNDINGRGDSAIEEALKAIALACSSTEQVLIVRG